MALDAICTAFESSHTNIDLDLSAAILLVQDELDKFFKSLDPAGKPDKFELFIAQQKGALKELINNPQLFS